MKRNKSVDYFISPGHQCIFLLVETDGKTRTRLLGMTKEMYYNPKLAKAWRDEVFSKIMSHTPDHPKCGEAIKKLDGFYNSMTETD